MESSEDLWKAVAPDMWEEVPFISNRVATHEDVLEGRSVFYIRPDYPHLPYEGIPLPSLGFINDENGIKQKIIIIQAEVVDDQITVGYRTFEGGNGVCLLTEVEIITSM